MSSDPERADASDMESMEDEDEQKPVLKGYNKDIIAALQNRIHDFSVDQLPASVKRRIKALKQLQLKTTHIEAKFYEEVHALECRYYQLCAPHYQERSNIISGIHEPTDEECVWESEEEEEEITNDLKSKVNIEVKDEADVKNDKNGAKDGDTKGIPDFWLTIFKNVAMLAEMVQDHDEQILKHLYDIKVIFLEKDPMGFVLEFHFSPNEHFSNSVLTKEYHMKCVPEKDDPFSFEGPEIYKCKGCIIDWKKGKNITVKTIKKSQKHKSRGSKRTVTKTVQNDSFFNFFNPPIVPDDAEAEIDDETQALLTTDFEIGHYIRERIVPRAVLYFTGEGLEDEDDEYDEDDDGDESDDDEADEEDDGDGTTGGKQEDFSRPLECKQQ